MLASTTRFTGSSQLDVFVEELQSAACNGLGIDVQEFCNLYITAVSPFHGFESCEHSSLLFIQHTEEQDDGGLDFFGYDLCVYTATMNFRFTELPGTGGDLSFLERGLAGTVEVSSQHFLSGYSTLLGQAWEHVP